jgi:dTDP-4-dehydrorhamnose reductase
MLVTGHRGQLGRALLRSAPDHGFDVCGADLPELDIADGDALRRAVLSSRPDVIVNCAAFTAVDAAEANEAEATRVNGGAVETLATLANETGACLVQVSTDYVFDGSLARPYREEDLPSPASAYGRSKLAGERAAARAQRHLIARTAWLFGQGGRNFVEAIRAQIAAGRTELRVVNDQVGSPTFAVDLSDALVGLVRIGGAGVIHVVNSGTATWFDFAREIVAQLEVDVVVSPITSCESDRAARRPANSVLDTTRLRALLGKGLPAWQDGLRRYLRATPDGG